MNSNTDSALIDALKVQNTFMVNLVLSNNIRISNELILVALHVNDASVIQALVSHLNTFKKYYDQFYLRFPELNYILKKDQAELIDCFKTFIHPETICCALNNVIENGEGILCLKKVLTYKIIKRPHSLYALLKTSVQKNGLEHSITQLISTYVTKRMVFYAVSDKDHILLNLVLNQLVKKLPVLTVNRVILRVNKLITSNHCSLVLNAYYKKNIASYRC